MAKNCLKFCPSNEILANLVTLIITVEQYIDLSTIIWSAFDVASKNKKKQWAIILIRVCSYFLACCDKRNQTQFFLQKML